MPTMSWGRFRQGFRHAFAVGQTETLSADEMAILDRAAKLIVSRQLAAPAAVFLESSRPLNFLASQGMVFFGTYLEPFLNTGDYRLLTRALEKRISIDYLLEAIDRQEQKRVS